MRDELDRFYTKNEEAKRLLNYIENLESYDLKIEPSAGGGSFSKQVKDSIAYDISPSSDDIIKQDFLTLQKTNIPAFQNLLFFGNPPFGKRSSLAKQFIKHCIELGATTIAFILPDTFKKRLNQQMFNEEWRLIEIIPLTDSNFIIDGETEIFIPCSFFIWTRNNQLQPGKNLRETKPPKPTDFKILGRGDKRADFTINGNNGKIKEIAEVTNPKAEHYIQILNRHEFKKIKKTLSNLKYNFYSSVNGGVAWINQEDIFRAYFQQK